MDGRGQASGGGAGGARAGPCFWGLPLWCNVSASVHINPDTLRVPGRRPAAKLRGQDSSGGAQALGLWGSVMRDPSLPIHPHCLKQTPGKR